MKCEIIMESFIMKYVAILVKLPTDFCWSSHHSDSIWILLLKTCIARNGSTSSLLQARRNREAGGLQPPRFLLKLAFCKLTMIIKRKN